MNTSFFKIEPDISFPYVKSELLGETGGWRYNSFIDKITDEKLYYELTPIELVFEYSEDGFKFGDFHWYGGTFATTKTLIVSEKLKSILEQLTLLPHRFYPAIIKTYLQGILTERADYFVFHFLQDYLQEIDFNHSQFAVGWFSKYKEEGKRREKFFKIFERGEIIDLEHYHAKLDEVLGMGPVIFPLELKFKKFYDVLSARFNMHFSQKAKKLVEENNITGIRFAEYNAEAELSTVFYIPKITV
ncbi:hypothetical protein [Emticicia fontis]